MGRQALALLGQLDAACAAAADLERAAVESFNLHPDAGIITSFPGLGALTGARVLAETGDDRSRFQDAKGLKAYAGAAPITRASGKTRSVTHRRVKNNRLAAAGYIWAFSALTASPGARGHYDRRRDVGDGHAAAERNLFGRLLGCLHQTPRLTTYFDELAAAMREWAKGLLCLEAAVGLLIGHGTWLYRQDFLDTAVEMVAGDGLEMAFVDFAAAAGALKAGGLSCSPGEKAVLQVAAGIAVGCPVDLQDALSCLDEANAALVAGAVLHAAGARR